jgi:hypothetical protein
MKLAVDFVGLPEDNLLPLNSMDSAAAGVPAIYDQPPVNEVPYAAILFIAFPETAIAQSPCHGGPL